MYILFDNQGRDWHPSSEAAKRWLVAWLKWIGRLSA
jgi:hypothetical protein